jgi:hypothetical protein
MNRKINDDYMERQTKLNLSDIYNQEEIKLLKKSIPEISNMIYLVSNNEFNNSDTSACAGDKTYHHQSQCHYLSPFRKTKSDSNTSFLIDKEKFYISVLNIVKQFFEKEKNLLLSKSIAIIMDDFLNISKIVKQNLIYYKFFKSIKNQKLLNYSSNKDNIIKYMKFKNNSVKSKKNSKNNNIVNRNSNTNENLKVSVKCSRETDINKSSDVKKQLSFKTEGNINKTKKIENNKSSSEINSLSKTNNKIYINSSPKKNKTTYNTNIIKNKTNCELNERNVYNNIRKRNINSLNNSSSQIKGSKKSDNNFLLGPSKISLKKKKIDNKKIETFAFMNTKNEHNLATNNKKSKIIFKDKENKSLSLQINYNKKISSPSSINFDLYKNIETQEFNIFKLEKIIGREMILPLIGYYVYNTFNFGEILKYKKFEKWCQNTADGYIRSNYYHNDLHAADITQTCLLYFKLGDLQKKHNFYKYEICTVFLSCMCHDYHHPGVNNNFLKETNDKLSIRYNDASILENMHISATFKLILSNKDCNIFEDIEKELYKKIRKGMISCVLATDMTFHNIYVDFLKNELKSIKENHIENLSDKNIEEKHQKYLNLLIHSSDISNPTKLFDIYFEWGKLVVEEFWAQGDKEKKLNLACSCDREKVTIYQSQLGFINFIEIPYFSLIAEMNPKLKFFYDNLLNNKNILLTMQEKEKEKKGNLK